MAATGAGASLQHSAGSRNARHVTPLVSSRRTSAATASSAAIASSTTSQAASFAPRAMPSVRLIKALQNLQGSLRLSDFQLALGGRRLQPRDTVREIVPCALEQDTPTKLVFVHGPLGKPRSCAGKLACNIRNSQIRLLASHHRSSGSRRVRGWRSRHRSCGPSAQFPCSGIAKFAVNVCSLDTNKTDGCRSLVPLAGIEPALLAELDFESSASTSSATGAFACPCGRKAPRAAKRAEYSGRRSGVNPRGCDFRRLDSFGA